jgi:hypothetical protein
MLLFAFCKDNQLLNDQRILRCFSVRTYAGDVRAADYRCVVMFEPTLINPWPLRGAGRQFPSQGFVRKSGIRRRNYCAPEPDASEPAKVLRFSRYVSMPFITYYHCNVGQEPRPISDVGLAFRPVFIPNSNFIIPHFILTPLSLSPSCRRPVPLQEGPRWLQHPGRGLRDQAPLCLPSPVWRLPRPRRRWRRSPRAAPRAAGGASPSTGSVRRRGRGRSHRGGGRRQRGANVANLDLGDVAIRGPGVGHTPSKTSSHLPAPLIGQARLGRRVCSHWTLSWFHIRNCVICHLTSQVGWLWYHGQYHSQYHGWYHRPMISGDTDIIDSVLWYHSFNSMISYMILHMILAMIS